MLLIVYFIYNNLNLIFLLFVLLGILLSNEKIRKIIYNRYNKYIDLGKNNIKIFLDINKELSSSESLEQEVKNDNEDIQTKDEELQKIIDEIKIS